MPQVFSMLGVPFTVLCCVCVFMVGCVFGSFMNCVAWRLVAGENPWKGRSHCTTCGHMLGALDLIPIISWVFSRGRCRHCGDKISPRYLLTESFIGILFLLLFLRYGLTIHFVAYAALVVVMLGLSLIDLDTMRIPNGFILAAIIIWVLYAVLNAVTAAPCTDTLYGDGPATLTASFFYGIFGAGWLTPIVDGLVGAVGLALLMLIFSVACSALLKKEALGGGDIKLFFVTGLYLGVPLGIFNVILACVLGLALGVVYARVVAKRADSHLAAEDKEGSKQPVGSTPFPFGPAIAAATVISLLVGPTFLHWYLALLL